MSGLQIGYILPLEVIRGRWFTYNNSIQQDIRVLNSSLPHKQSQIYSYMSICYNAPMKHWKTNQICKAHLKCSGKDINKMKITSLQLHHECCTTMMMIGGGGGQQQQQGQQQGQAAGSDATTTTTTTTTEQQQNQQIQQQRKKRKRGQTTTVYRAAAIALREYRPPPDSKKHTGAAKQLIEIAKSCGIHMTKAAAYREIARKRKSGEVLLHSENDYNNGTGESGDKATTAGTAGGGGASAVAAAASAAAVGGGGGGQQQHPNNQEYNDERKMACNTINRSHVDRIRDWLCHEVIGYNANYFEMEEYAYKLVHNEGLHSVKMIQQMVTLEDIMEEFIWMKKFHKRALIQNGNLKNIATSKNNNDTTSAAASGGGDGGGGGSGGGGNNVDLAAPLSVRPSPSVQHQQAAVTITTAATAMGGVAVAATVGAGGGIAAGDDTMEGINNIAAGASSSPTFTSPSTLADNDTTTPTDMAVTIGDR